MNPTSTAPTSAAVQTRVAIAACFGTFLEWYDFLTFAALAIYFGALFFPPDNPVAALLASLATFGVGMVVRPLGAAIFGSLGDRIGRRKVFIATIVLMGISTFGVGLLPTYAQVGLLAPALLLLLRLLQGMAMGGEIGGAVVYLTEHAPAQKRGIYTSVLQLMGPLGIMASTFQIVLLQGWLSDAEFRDWGWRVPFLLSIVLLAISLKSRLALHESPVFAELRAQNGLSRTPLADCFRDRHTLGRMALLFFCISAGGSLLFFSSQVYSTVFLKNVVKLDPKDAGTIVMVATLALFPLTIFCGWLSDRIGRRPVLLAGLLIGVIGILPVFHGLLHYGNPALEAFHRDVKIEVHGSGCDYSPFRKAASDCEKIQELFARKGVNYTLAPAAALTIKVGGSDTAATDATAVEAALVVAGWPEKADPAQVDRGMLIILLLILVVAVAAITGPQTATLAELFPARTRYSAVALPHNLSAGWIGGLSPFMVTFLSVQSGNALAGLWYPVALLGMAAVVGLLFLPETRNAPLDR
ncbi:MAG: MFS transporter [Gammaproteobacteria bacterium]|nr:MFS transporter [Gammaproteobacteria bacterium]MBU1646709.1 MFS transporter [Gammaproteobacteria bacterium]MBU1971742.1 MFS transporter [Gammaproteobacteria bacterium]